MKTMSAVRTSMVKRRHAYTSVDIPWDMDKASDSRFFRYLRGGGLRTFGTSSLRELRAYRQTRFLVFAAIVFVIWCVLFFV